MLSYSKRLAILNWVQTAGNKRINSLRELKDGKTLSKLVLSLYENIQKQVNGSPEKIESLPAVQKELTTENNDQSHSFQLLDVHKAESTHESKNSAHNCVLDLDADLSNDSEKTEPGELVIDETEIDVEEIATEGVCSDVQQNSVIHFDTYEEIVVADTNNEVVIADKNNSINTLCDNSVQTSGIKELWNNELTETKSLNVETSYVNRISEVSCDDNIEKNFEIVKNFIDSMLELSSKDFINFDKCKEAVDVELAKLSYMLLAAMVQYGVSTGNDAIYATCLSLSVVNQEEIMDCLELFLTERLHSVSENEFLTVLKRSKSQRRSSPRVNSPSFTTPRKGRGRKNLKRKLNAVSEDFSDLQSPFQALLNSDSRRKITPNSEALLLKAVRGKDKEIVGLSYELDSKKEDLDDLKKLNEELQNQLSKLEKKFKDARRELSETRDTLLNQEESFAKEKKEMENKIRRQHQEIVELKKDIQFLREESPEETCKSWNESPVDSMNHCGIIKDRIKELEYFIEMKDIRIKELEGKVQILKINLEIAQENKVDSSKNVKQLENGFPSETCKSIVMIETKEATVQNVPETMDEFSQTMNLSKIVSSKNVEQMNSSFSLENGETEEKPKECRVSYLDKHLELREKHSQLIAYFKVMSNNFEKKIKELEDEITWRTRKEEELKSQLRSADRQRETYMKTQKKLEIENEKLKAQMETYEKMGLSFNYRNKKIPSPINSEQTPFNKKSSNQSPKGVIWSTFAKNSPSARNKSSTNKDLPNDSQNFPCDSSRGKLHFSSRELNYIKSLVQIASKNFKNKNNQNLQVLNSLQSYEDEFDVEHDLIDFLELIGEIAKEPYAISSTFSKHKRGRSCDLELTKANELQALSEQNEQLKRDLEKLKRQVETTKSNLRETQTVSSVLVSEKENVQERPSLPKEKSIKKDKVNTSTQTQKTTDLTVKYHNLKGKLEDQLFSLKSYEKEMNNLKLKIQKLKADSKSKDLELIRLKESEKDCEELKKRNATLEARLETMKIKNVAQPKTFNCECEQLKLENKKLKEEKDLKSEEIQCLDKSLSALKCELNRLLQDNNYHSARCIELENELKLTRKQIEHEKAFNAKVCGGNELKRISERLKDVAEENERKRLESSEESENDQKELSDDENKKSTGSLKNCYSFKNSKKPYTFCNIEDEEDFLSQSSINESQISPRKTPFISSSQRVKEIQRRNSLYLPHMKSVYPLELNTTPSQAKYFKVPSPTVQQMQSFNSNNNFESKESDGPVLKKRKILRKSQSSSLSSLKKPWNPPCSTPKEGHSFAGKVYKNSTGLFRRSTFKIPKTVNKDK